MGLSKFVVALLSGCAFSVSVEAQAQVGVAGQNQEADKTAIVASDPQAGSSPDAQGEVVVTAQRRSERLVDVPIAITSVSSEQLSTSGTTNFESLSKTVPSLSFAPQVTYLAPFIRGVGQVISQDLESSVSTYVDGVYQPTASSNVFNLASVTGIEVLKGPQGTLFGRNATGGAILISTADPSSQRAARFNFSVARFNEVQAAGYVNVPIADGIAFNVAGSYRYSGGYIHDLRTGEIVNDGHDFVGRAKLLLQPTDKLTLILTAARNDFDDPTYSDSRTTLDGRTSVAALPGAGPLATKRGERSSDVRDVVRTHANEFNLRAAWDLGFAKLSSTTALKREELQSRFDSDLTYIPLVTLSFLYKTRGFEQELLLNGKVGASIDYVLGGFYFSRKTDYPFFTNNDAPFVRSSTQNYASAGFADLTYKVGRLSIIGGIRYGSEVRKQQNGPGTTITHVARVVDSAWTPRGGLRFAIDDHSNVYAMYSRGFKSGAYSTVIYQGTGVSPEVVNAYELGYKRSMGGLSLTVDGFLQDYTNIQTNVIDVVNNALIQRFVNAGASRIWGVEAEAHARLSPRMELNLGGSYNHAIYTRFPNAPIFSPLPNGGSVSLAGDVAGNSMTYTPRVTLNGSATYTLPVGNDRLGFTLAGVYSSRTYYNFESTLSRPPLTIVDAVINYKVGDNLTLRAFGRNLLDAHYVISLNRSQLGDSATWGRPRTYGVGASYTF